MPAAYQAVDDVRIAFGESFRSGRGGRIENEQRTSIIGITERPAQEQLAAADCRFEVGAMRCLQRHFPSRVIGRLFVKEQIVHGLFLPLIQVG
jgi:hypothetical protein